MRIIPFGSRRARDDGVSEVVGTLFLLVMTVAFFSIIMLWVYGFDSPEGETYVNLFPDMERQDTMNTTVSIIHRGGEALSGGHVSIIVTVQNASFSQVMGPYNFQNGSGGQDEWRVGGVWSMDFSTVPEDANVELRVIDRNRETLVLDTMLQRGMQTGAPAPPILGVPVVLPDNILITDGTDSFYIQAVAVDFNGDLPTTGVVADLTPIWPGLGTVVLEYKGFDTYRSTTITVPLAAVPGKKNLKVTATDSRGFVDTNYANCVVRTNDDNKPPVVAIVSPTTSEIVAGRVKQIAASYTDPSGIDTSTLVFQVWEDGVALDTSTKTVTDHLATFIPFGGFQQNSLYLINVSVEDNEGLRGYAEMLFRINMYSQPGNPRGETSFDIMNKSWQSTVVFFHDDYIRLQVWSAIIPRIDSSEIRLTRTDNSNVYLFSDRFAPNMSMVPSGPNPWYIYDATINVASDGTYGDPVEPGYYALRLHVKFYDNNVDYINQIFITIKYDDGSDPDNGNFITYNTTGKWTNPTVDFDHDEHVYVQIITEDNLEWDKWTGSPPVHYICTIRRAIVTVSEVYGENILYVEIPRYQIQAVGPGMGGFVYRLGVDLNDTIGGSNFFSSTNWYPIEVSIETQIQHIKFGRIWTTYDIAFQAGTQIRITRPCDIGLAKNDLIIFHEDDTTTEQNKTVLFGETLYIYVKVWNYGEVHVTNARVQVWAIADGVALDYWDLTTDDNFDDPNLNGMLDSVFSDDNYVEVIIPWNTTRTGYDQATLEKAKIKVSVSILTPVKGGAASDPILEHDYDNNEVVRGLLEPSDGKLEIKDIGYITPTYVDIGQLDVVVDRLEFSASGGNVHVMGINITLTGTARDTDIRWVILVEDVNKNGMRDSADRVADFGKFTAGLFKASDNRVIFDGDSIQYLILYDIADVAVATRSLGSSISVYDDVFVEAPGYIINPLFPYASEKSIIQSNKNELDGKGIGPAAAFRDSYLIYALSLTAYNADAGKLLEGSLTITKITMEVTGWANVSGIWLIDDGEEVLDYSAPASTVTFTGLRYPVEAATGRVVYVALYVKADTAQGEVIGIEIDRTDVTLSSAQDVVLNTFGITVSTTIQLMANYFEYKVGAPMLDPTFLDTIYGMYIGSTDPTVNIVAYGITVSWDDPDKPQWVDKIYIDGELVFDATGVTHKGNGQFLYFIEPVTITNSPMSFRIEFNDQVIHKQWGKGDKYNNNNIYFEWHFWDDSSTMGGQYVEVSGGPHYSISWA